MNKLFCRHCFKSAKIMVINFLNKKDKYTFPNDYFCNDCNKKAIKAMEAGLI